MIAARIAADDTLTTAVAAQSAADVIARAALQADVDQNESDADTAIAAETARVDALIASGMWLYANQAAFPAASSSHGRVVHSHADGAMYYAHAGAWYKLSGDAAATQQPVLPSKLMSTKTRLTATQPEPVLILLLAALHYLPSKLTQQQQFPTLALLALDSSPSCVHHVGHADRC